MYFVCACRERRSWYLPVSMSCVLWCSSCGATRLTAWVSNFLSLSSLRTLYYIQWKYSLLVWDFLNVCHPELFAMNEFCSYIFSLAHWFPTVLLMTMVASYRVRTCTIHAHAADVNLHSGISANKTYIVIKGPPPTKNHCRHNCTGPV